jgi:histone acetyltransferase (RNA polymerase elongator complex component)
MRFPGVDFESDLQSCTNDFRCPSHSDNSVMYPLFVTRDMVVIDMEMGFFAHETREQILARRAQRQKTASTAVVVFGVLGILAWATSVVSLTRG